MKNMKNALVGAMLFTSAITATAQVTVQADEDEKYATELLKPGTQVPDFEMRTIDGNTFRLSDVKGKIVVIDFWASWCPDCRKDAPNIVRLYDEYHGKGVEFVGVSMDTDVEAWKNGVEKYNIPYTQVSELKKFHDTDISKAYGVKWIPSMYLIGKDGKVVLGTVMSEKLGRCIEEYMARQTAE